MKPLKSSKRKKKSLITRNKKNINILEFIGIYKKRIHKKRKKIWILNSLIVFGIILLILLFLYLKGVFLAPPPPEKKCTIIFQNPGNKKVDIVFITNKVNQDKINEYIKFFLDSEPFTKNKEKFNFYYAGEANCKIMKGIALYCYSKELIRKSSVCPNDYIIVLSEQPKKIRSSAYLNVMSININGPKSLILHEFGHIFANLADEYVPSTIPWGSKNCQKKCENFEKLSKKYGELEGCFIECSEEDYYRSSENSVMRTLKTTDYGKLNKGLIKEFLENYK